MIVATYAAMIQQRIHFAQAGYRDGEFYCMLGATGANINGEVYDSALASALRDTLMRPVGQWCMFWEADPSPPIREQALAWIAKHKPPVSWLPERPIFRAVLDGAAAPFFAACRTRRIILIGPEHLFGLDLFRAAALFPVPPHVAWRKADQLADEALAAAKPDDLILVAAGMGANLIVHRIWGALKHRVTVMDIGSSLDPFCGVFSRGPFRDEKWQREIMPRNVP